ncbi:head-tail adaptor protein [Sphingorhabdus sp.]|jgi:head-tail adaptor|uniref:phage head completion protein n=1 Tax=Sphingorhabdus sp. TaxID=1902408 RepID=UPI0037CA32ED
MPLDLASSLDTRIRIERKLVTRDPQYGTEQVTWGQFAYVWAEVRDILPSKAERLADSVQIARRPARIRIRYLAGLVADMRVIFDNRIHQIVSGPATLGRREAMEIMVEEHSSQGTAP